MRQDRQWAPVGGEARVPPGDVDGDDARLDGLEDGDGLAVGEPLHWQPVDRENLVT